MSGGGGKGGESRQSIDPRLAAASAEAIKRATEASKIPYSPNRGVTIAAFTPQQEAAMKNASSAATAFGMEGGDFATMPKKEMSAGGIAGYSSGAEYDDMINKSLSPALQEAINSFFIDRKTGAQPGARSGEKKPSFQDEVKKILNGAVLGRTAGGK